ncbi:bifunctional tetrahydrofolate synthase/dihydrofolate synthase [Microbulbifer sp. 2205BS26-8]|uniref:bifunctional tetrahydrofolate synthase/dihydrofolate synthase n=1 Tax=Microbulbifer sp. 2205BS26-8 TaxID=3064386 RepID=UPI00273F7F65|nr:bifunctional tetrahydrofolate synthase/dihydrofolate synthase [Microbulbifer sp. 2205BS26-8]MDP5209937.1 bifunctional tetrahydrofolate synthase/dihydrofolate synthase [Microbulbifer sp. 2205BS26-8]
MLSLQDWLSRLERLHPTEIELGLERVSRVARALGVQKPAPTVITVAGTNGKGTCVAVMEALLCSAGRSVGAYSSPHLLRFNERVRINGRAVPDKDLVRAFEVVEAARGETSLTYFEFTTLAALWLYQRAGIEFALLEVGLGGRLDAVNLVDTDLAIITSVAMDHEDWLGSDREMIGSEKAGILRPGIPFVCADRAPPRSVVSAAENLAGFSYFIDRDFTVAAGSGGGLYRFGALTLTIPPINLSYASTAAAITALALLNALPQQGIGAVLSRIALPGRCQQVQWRERTLLLDVGHNPAAAAHLARWLESHRVTGETHALVAAMADKNLSGLFAPLTLLVDRWHPALLPDNIRAAGAGALCSGLRAAGIEVTKVDSRCPTVATGLQQLLLTIGPQDRLLVFGSFFTVAEVLQQIRDEGNGELRGQVLS